MTGDVIPLYIPSHLLISSNVSLVKLIFKATDNKCTYPCGYNPQIAVQYQFLGICWTACATLYLGTFEVPCTSDLMGE